MVNIEQVSLSFSRYGKKRELSAEKKNNPTTRSTQNLIPEALHSTLDSITPRDEPALENCDFVACEYFTRIFQLCAYKFIFTTFPISKFQLWKIRDLKPS